MFHHSRRNVSSQRAQCFFTASAMFHHSERNVSSQRAQCFSIGSVGRKPIQQSGRRSAGCTTTGGGVVGGAGFTVSVWSALQHLEMENEVQFNFLFIFRRWTGSVYVLFIFQRGTSNKHKYTRKKKMRHSFIQKKKRNFFSKQFSFQYFTWASHAKGKPPPPFCKKKILQYINMKRRPLQLDVEIRIYFYFVLPSGHHDLASRRCFCRHGRQAYLVVKLILVL